MAASIASLSLFASLLVLAVPAAADATEVANPSARTSLSPSPNPEPSTSPSPSPSAALRDPTVVTIDADPAGDPRARIDDLLAQSEAARRAELEAQRRQAVASAPSASATVFPVPQAGAAAGGSTLSAEQLAEAGGSTLSAEQLAEAARAAEEQLQAQAQLQALLEALSAAFGSQCTAGQGDSISCSVDDAGSAAPAGDQTPGDTSGGTADAGDATDAGDAADATDAEALTAASLPVSPAEPMVALTEPDLAAALAQATAEWQAAGGDVSGISASISDLPGAELGNFSGSAIVIDHDAAGWGWDAMDLLTVVRHELGHALGLEHTTSGLMAETLAPGAGHLVVSLAPDPAPSVEGEAQASATDTTTTETAEPAGVDSAAATDSTTTDASATESTTTDASATESTTTDASATESTSTTAVNTTPSTAALTSTESISSAFAGTSGGDTVTVGVDPSDPTKIRVEIAGGSSQIHDPANSLSIDLGAGDDRIIIGAGALALLAENGASLTIIGGAGADTIELADDSAGNWSVTAINAGSWEGRSSQNTFDFSGVESLVGALTAEDAFDFSSGAALTGTVDDRGGNVKVSAAGFVQVESVDIVASTRSDVETNSGPLTSAWVMTVSGAAALGLIGAEVLNDPIGVEGTFSDFALLIVTDGTNAWHAFVGTMTSPSIVGPLGTDIDIDFFDLLVDVNDPAADDSYLLLSATTWGLGNAVLDTDTPGVAAQTTATIELSDYVVVTGVVSFRKNELRTVDIATGLPQNLLDVAATLGITEFVNDALGLLPFASDPGVDTATDVYVSDDYSVIHNVPIASMEITFTAASIFIGDNPTPADGDGDRPAFVDTNGDGLLQEAELDENAVGLFAHGINAALLLLNPKPTGIYVVDKLFPKMMALKATIDDVSFVGWDALDFSAGTVEVRVNNGTTWPGGLGPPVVDFTSLGSGWVVTNPSETVSFTFDFDGNQRIGASVERLVISLGDYVHLAGSISFEKGPTQTVEVATGLPSNAVQIIQAAIDAAAGASPELEALLDFFESLPVIGAGNTDPDELQISSNWSTIRNVQVVTTQIGGSNLSVFVGYNPNWQVDESGTLLTPDPTNDPDAIGVYATGVQFGLVFMVPTLSFGPLAAFIPTFKALTLHIPEAGFVGMDAVTATLTNVDVAVNDGTPWAGVFGPPVVNFANSYPAETPAGPGPASDDDKDGIFGEPAGYQVATGGVDEGGDPVYVYIAHDGNQRYRATAERVQLSIGDYVHVGGSFAFEKGPVVSVDVATWLSAHEIAALQALKNGATTAVELFGLEVLADLAEEFFSDGDPEDGSFAIDNDFSTIWNLEVDTFTVAVSNLSVFIGYNPGWVDTNNNGLIDVWVDTNNNGLVDGDETADELSEAAIGFYGSDIDFGLVMMSPTLNQIPALDLPSFWALRGSGDLGIVGADVLTATLTGVEIRINQGDEWPGELGPPVVDWQSSFGAGFEIPTGNPLEPVVIDFDGQPRIQIDVARGLLQIGDFVHVAGSFSFTTGPGEVVTVATGLPANLVENHNLIPAPIRDAIDWLLLNAAGITNNGYASLSDVEVAVIEMGASAVDIFVGFDLDWVDKDGDGRIDYLPNDAANNEVGPNAFGAFASNIEFGFVQMTPTLESVPGLGQYVPTFYAMSAHADTLAVLGADAFRLTLSDVTVNVNNGDPWPGGLGPPVVDFATTWEAETADEDEDGIALEPAGYGVKTGAIDGDGNPVYRYIDFDGNQRIGFSVGRAVLTIGDFVHVAGSLAFEMGPTTRVDISTRFSTELRLALMAGEAVAEEALDALGLGDLVDIPTFATKEEADGKLAFSSDYTKIWNLEVSTFQIGASGVSLFVGYNPGWTDGNSNGVIDGVGELHEDAIGLLASNVEFGLGMFDPTLGAVPGLDRIFPQMWAMRLGIETAAFVGGDLFSAALGGVSVYMNSGKAWPGGQGPPVINFATSYPAVTCPSGGEDPCTPAPAGFPVGTGDAENPVYLDFPGLALVGFSAERVLLSIGEYVHVTGSFSYEQGGLETVTVATALPANLLDLITNSPANELVAPILAAINELLAAAGTGTQISSDYTTITGLLVGTVRVGFSDASLFVGFNPGWGGTITEHTDGKLYFASDTDHDGIIDEAELGDDAIGLLVSDVDFGMVMMTPTLKSVTGLSWLPTFTAFKLNAGLVKLVGVPEITATLTGIEVYMNNGDAWPGGFGPPVVDFAATWGAEPAGTDPDGDGIVGESAGYQVDTGDVDENGDPVSVYLDFNGNQRIGLSVEKVLLVISDFVYLTGSFAFEIGPTYRVDVATGLPLALRTVAEEAFGPLLDELGATQPTKPTDGSLAISSDFSTIWNVEVSSLQLGASDVTIFVGFAPKDEDGNLLLDPGENGTLEEAELEGAVGFYASDIDFGFGMFTPTGTGLDALDKFLPKFYALKADGALLKLIGIPGVTISAENVHIEVNNGTPWPGPLGPPVINFQTSFADLAEAEGQDDDGDGRLGEPAGFQVNTGGTPIYLDFDGNQRIGGGADRVTIQLSQFVYLTGSIYFEYGPVQTVQLIDGPLDTSIVSDILDLLGVDQKTFDEVVGLRSKEVSFLTIGGENINAFVGIGGPYWTWEDDLVANGGNGNLAPDENEVNQDAVGVALSDLDFGLAFMTPTNPFDPTRYLALKATAQELALVGIDDENGVDYITVTAQGIEVELNLSMPTLNGFPLLPVVNFATTDFFGQGIGNGFRVRTAVTQPPPDICDPATQPCGVVLGMDSYLIRVAAELVYIDLASVVTLWGSFALVIGPNENVNVVTLGGSVQQHSVSVMTLGLANLSGFVGWGGPYWTLERDAAGDGDGEFDANEANGSAKGIHITDADLGVVVAVDTTLTSPGVWLGAKLDITTFGLVGLGFLGMSGTLGVALNLGAGVTSGGLNVSAINWASSFDNDTVDNTEDDGYYVETGNSHFPVKIDSDTFLISVFLAGNITVKAGTATNAAKLVQLDGAIFFELTSSSFQLFASGSLRVGPDIDSSEPPLLKIDALGAVIINASGVAADLSLKLELGTPELGLTVKARLILNTTGDNQSVTLPDRLVEYLEERAAEDRAAGVPESENRSQQLIDRLDDCGPTGDEGSVKCYTVKGAAPDLSTADGADLSAIAALLDGGDDGVTYQPAGAYVFIALSGKFNFLDFAEGSGLGAISVSGNAFQLVVDLNFSIGTSGLGVDIEASGLLEIRSDGIVVDIDVSISMALSAVISIDVSGSLKINTVDGNSYFRLDLSGRVDILGVITVSGGLIIEVDHGAWKVEVPQNNPLKGTFGPLTISAHGFIQSDGQFLVSVSAGVKLGSDDWGIRGDGTVTIALLKEENFDRLPTSPRNYPSIAQNDTPAGGYFLFGQLRVSVAVRAFGATILGASATATVHGVISGTESYVTVNLEVCVTIIFEFCGDYDIATIRIPPTILREQPPKLAQMAGDGQTLELNVGDIDASRRTVGTGVIDEHYTITQIGGDATSGYTVQVSAFGRSETFKGVRTITGDFGSGNDSFVLYESATSYDPVTRVVTYGVSAVPVDIRGGDGSDLLDYRGSGAASLHGDAGGDEISGGSGPDILRGGAGPDRIAGGAGVDDIDGGADDDVIFGAPVDIAGETIKGGTGTDIFQLSGSEAGPDDVTISVANGKVVLTDGTGGAASLDAVEDLTVFLGAGADDITLVGDLSAGGLSTLTIAASDYGTEAADTVTMQLSSTDDVVTLTGAVAPALIAATAPGKGAVQPGVDAIVPNVPTTTAAWSYTLVVSQATLASDVLVIEALDGADTVLARGIGGDTTLEMGSGDDTVYVGSAASTTGNTAGTLEAIDAKLQVDGGTGSADVLDIDDSGDADGETGTLTNALVTGLGMGGSVGYIDIDTLQLWLGTGADTANIQSTSTSVTTTAVNAGAGSDTINVSGAAADMLTGDLDGIAGALTIDGGTGTNDQAFLSDYGDTSADTGTLSSTQLTGFSPAAITYRALDRLHIDLGQGGDTLTISSVMAGPTVVETNGGADQVFVNGVAVGSNLTLNTDAAEDTVTVNSISGTATINGTDDADRIIIDHLASTAVVTVNGLAGNDHITIRSTDAGSVLTINGNDGADWIDVVSMNGTVNINGGAGDDTIEVGSLAESTDQVVDTGGNVNGIQGALTVNGNAPQASDWLYLDETGETTTQTGTLTSTTVGGLGLGTPITYVDIEHLVIRTGSGHDVFNVLSTNGPSDTPVSATESTLEMGAGNDTVNVSSNAPANTGDVNAVLGHLVIDGQGGADTLNVSDRGDTVGNTGTLTGTDLTGLGMGTTVGSAGITYDALEHVNIDLGFGGDTFTVESTHAGQTTLDTLAGADAVNIRTLAGHTLVDTGADDDTVTVGSTAAVLGGDVNGIGALLEVTGGNGDDNLIVDDTGDSSANVGVVTGTTVEGLGMTIGATHAGSPSDAVHVVTVANAFDGSFTLTIGGSTTSALAFDASADDVRAALLAAIGGGFDAADIQITRVLHDLELTYVIAFVGQLAGTAGWDLGALSVDGTELIGLADYGAPSAAAASSTTGRIEYVGIELLDIRLGDGADTVHVRSTHTTATTVAAGEGNDVLLLETIAGTTTLDGGAGDDTLVVNPLEGIPSTANGILGHDLTIDGAEGSDLYVVNTWNTAASELTIHDSGTDSAGIDRLTVYGTSLDDTFLLRAGMIAALSAKVDGAFTQAEKILYDNTIEAGVTLNTLAGNDLVVFDDNSSLITVNGGKGDDTFQIGQLLGGTIGDTLNVDTELTGVTRGQLTNGVSFNATINGGSGNDLFNVFHNLAPLQLNGDTGDDTFVVRTFLGIDGTTSINAGEGRDLIDYVWNAPVSIDGGPGFDTIVIIGTEAADEFVITEDGVYGAGRYVAFIGVEQLDVDGAEGDDVFFVLSTAPGVVVRIFGGLGSDTINVGADANAVYGDDLLGHTGLIAHSVESTCAAGAAGCVAGDWDGTAVDGVAAEIIDDDEVAVVVVESGGTTVVSEAGTTDSYLVVLNTMPTSEVHVTVSAPSRSPEGELHRSYAIELSLDGVNWFDGVTLVFTSDNWATPQTVYVRAHGDLSSEGDRSAALQHLVVSGDAAYDGLPINNVMVRTIDDERAGLVVLESGADTVVIESGTGDTFTVALTRAPLTTTTVTFNGGDQLCVSLTAGGNPGCGPVTLTFTPGNWSTARTIFVRAKSDAAVESFHFGYVSTTVASSDVFAGTVVSAVGTRITITGAVHFAENALRGYLFRVTAGTGAGQWWDIWSNAESTGSAGNWTTLIVLQGEVEVAIGAGATYHINGYTPPILTDVIAGTIVDDADLTDAVVTITGVTLPTANGGLSGATIRIFKADGTTEYRTILFHTASTITVDSPWVLTAGQAFSIVDVAGVSVPLLATFVADDDSHGVLIRETDGASNVAEGATSPTVGLQYDSYTVVLTRAPAAGETVTVRVTPVASETLNGSDWRDVQQLCVAKTLAGVVSTPGPSCGAITLTFNSTNWNVPQIVYLWAIDDDFVDGGDLQDFADSSQRTYLIQGPLFVDGGTDELADRSFPDPVLLPGETSAPLVLPPDPAFDTIEDRQVDTLNVHNEDSVSADVGNLTDTRLTGLGMGPDQFVGGRFLPGGITYADLEALNIHLGRGSDQFTIDSTHTGVTVVTGNDGDDTFTIRTIAGHTNLRGDDGDDTFAIGNNGGTVDDLDALLVIDGGAGDDDATVDDTGDTDDNLGTLTQTTITGLDMVGANGDRLYSLTIGTTTTHVTFTVTIPGRSPVMLTLAVGFDADELATALQNAIFPVTDGGPDALPITGCGLGGDDAVVTPELDTPCSQSVFVWSHGDDLLIGFRGELQGIDVGLSVAPSGASPAGATATDVARVDGINYYGFDTDELLTILLGAGDDRFNVRGTLPHTRLRTAGGDDVVFVSDTADLAGLQAAIAASNGSLTDVHDDVLHGTVAVDDLTFHGSLDLIAGDLDIDTGAGSNTLAVSDRADTDADTDARITSSSITGFSAGDITYVSTGGDLAGQGKWALEGDSGMFGRGVTVHAGTGADVITIESALGGAIGTSPLQLTITTLYANDGNDRVTITAPAAAKARLVVYGEDGDDTIDASGAGLPLIVFGNDGNDTIQGGSGADVLLGDDGRVFLFDDGQGFDVILGGDPVAIPDSVAPGGSTVGQNQVDDGVFETIDVVFSLYEGGSANDDSDNDDIVRGGGGDDLVIGGIGDDGLDGQAGRDIVVGDQAIFTRHDPGTSPLVRELAGATIYGGVRTTHQVDPRMGELDWTITLLDHASDTPSHLYGDDVVAGGAGADYVFGQLGNDTLHGDGALLTGAGGWTIATNANTATDADDHLEGGGGADHIRGGLGQDSIIGGSSNLFGLVSPAMRPDGADSIWGGNGDQVDRNELGVSDHGRDADVILGDNGNVFRLVGTNGALLAFNYDNLYGGEQIVPRAVQLLDYSPTGETGPYWNAAAPINPSSPQLTAGSGSNVGYGGGDLIHGEDGNDTVHGQTGNDVIFGDAHDDDIYGEAGTDFISGGTGDDGILGDDGTIHTSRNGLTEPLHGVTQVASPAVISTPGNLQTAEINHTGELNKAVDLEPFYSGYNDIAFGGWGNDFIHGGEGDDALSGAEALALYYVDDAFGRLASIYEDPTDILNWGFRPGEFEFYDEFNPLAKVLVGGNDFLLNNDASENAAGADGDGKDVLFGDGGNDWLVGGTNQDHLYGGWGDDLLDADDDPDTNGGANDAPDVQTGPPSYADIAYGGAGRDILIANTGADRLIDWVGEFNSYIVPFSPFGAFTISRSIAPHLLEYLYDLSASDGADFTRGDTFNPDRNGEPYGELGLVNQRDADWHGQTGAPGDPQAGNLRGPRDVLRSEDFSATSTALAAFAPDSGDWAVVNGRYESQALKGADAVSLFYVDQLLPSYYEVTATVSADKAKGGYNANAYLVFDYQSSTDYKFAGIEIGTSKVQIGRRTASGFEVLAQANLTLVANRNYDLVAAINGQTVTLYVDGVAVLSYTFASPLIDPTDPSLGVVDPLTDGMIGVGSNGAKMRLTRMAVQTLAPEITFTHDDEFDVAPTHQLQQGTWTVANGRLFTTAGGVPSLSLTSLTVSLTSIIEAQTTVAASGLTGLAFDTSGPDRFKLVLLDASGNRLLIGYYVDGALTVVAETSLEVTGDTAIGIRLDGNTVVVLVDGAVVLSHAFFSLLNDGALGLVAFDGTASFSHLQVQTDDPDLTPALPLVSVADVTVTEGNGAGQVVVTVTLSRPAEAPVTVHWTTVDGTAIAGLDFTGASGTLTIAAGQQSGTIVIQMLGDAVEEADEYFMVAIADITGAFIGDGSGRVTIANDDTSVTVAITATDDSASEVGPDPATFEVSRTGATDQPLAVRISWSGAAVRGVDYLVTVTGGTLSADGRTLTIAAGNSSAVVTITPLGDGNAEGVENVTLTIDPQAHYAVSTGAATAAVQDDASLPTVSIADLSVAEGDRKGWATVTLTLSAPSSTSVTVTVRTYDGTASAGSDYAGYVGVVTFAPGQVTATLDLRILGDRLREGDETFTVELSGPAGAVIADGVGVVTIYDDDGARLIAATAGPSDGSGSLSAADLRSSVQRAIDQWIAAGVHASVFDGLRIEVGELDGVILAETVDGVLVIDADAAGWGWHLDPDTAVRPGTIDLYSVLLHELGHLLGLDHTHAGVMTGRIEAGARPASTVGMLRGLLRSLRAHLGRATVSSSFAV